MQPIRNSTTRSKVPTRQPALALEPELATLDVSTLERSLNKLKADHASHFKDFTTKIEELEKKISQLQRP